MNDLVRQFVKRKSAVAGALIVLAVAIVGLFGPLMAPYDPAVPDYDHVFELPSAAHWLGTDSFGRDILSRILYGARISLSVALIGVVAGGLVGTPIGVTAGYFGGWWDSFIMRVMDVLLAFPGILLAIGIIAVLGPGLPNVVIAVAIFGTPIFARIVRGVTLSIRAQEYLEAARAIGAPASRILWRHILRNATGPIIVQATLRSAEAILIASSLSFLGFGARPPTSEWGYMLAEGRDFIDISPHVALFPGLAIFLTVLGFNMLGDGLSDALDPHLRQ